MDGPTILARTMTVATTRGGKGGERGRAWQYHSRSDNHSKVACWTVLFDLMRHCDVFREHVRAGRVGFGINHVMVGPINKTLDLVVTRLQHARQEGMRSAFSDLVEVYGIRLSASERADLDALPPLFAEDGSQDVSEVVIALEAKACMTEHSKSLPRLHAEILATGYLARLAQPSAITVSYTMVNASESFVTPSGEGKVNRHCQPDDARKTLEMLAKAIPLARQTREIGYDVVGATVVDCRNDGSEVSVVIGAPAPDLRTNSLHYDRMVTDICAQYNSRFGR